MPRPRPPRIGFVSLGCPKNLVDSERILTQLRAEGYELAPTYQGADLVVVNTCGFIDAAVQESLETIGDALEENGRVIVTGCLGAKAGTIREAHPGVLEVTGPHEYAAVMSAVHRHLPAPHEPWANLVPAQGVKLTPQHYAYLKIAEGCGQACTFCIIPQLRGGLVSRPVEEVLREAENLAASGVRELLVVSQDTAAYGVDLKYRPGLWRGGLVKTRLADLARALGELGIWIRLHYIYPYPAVDEIVPLMAEGLILPYLDIPLQHAAPDLLRRMRRPAHAERMLDRIQGWRATCPDLTLRSTFIVGFPGETEEEFETLLTFLREARLDRVGAFTYSPVEGAPANAFPDPVPEDEKQERLERLMEVQAEVSAANLARKVGSRMVVMVDEVADDHVIARSAADAPEIDGCVFIDGAWELEPGDFVEVNVIGADAHDLTAEMADPED